MNCVIFYIFATALSPRNNNYGKRNKSLKNKDIHNASLACVINSMSNNFILFCEIWLLTSSFFGTHLRSRCLIFSHQIMQENWLTYCLISRFFTSQYPLLFVDSIYVVDTHEKTVRMHSFWVNIRICQPSKVMSTSPSPR